VSAELKSPDFPHVRASLRLCGDGKREHESAHIGAWLVLPVRIELTTSPLPRGYAIYSIYLTRLNFWTTVSALGADLVLQAASPALIVGASCDTFTWA
jgi:hypothetical protein